MHEFVERYAKAFGAEWQADPARLLAAAIDRLARTGSSSRSPAGCSCCRSSAATATCRSGSSAANRRCSTSGRSRDHRCDDLCARPHAVPAHPRRDHQPVGLPRRGVRLRDGRLVLRGPNGSGKTKALEVLFPFVLDGRIEPRRLNPFACEDRTMKSNLLYRGQESAGYAYVWMEFGDGERRGRHGRDRAAGAPAQRQGDALVLRRRRARRASTSRCSTPTTGR